MIDGGLALSLVSVWIALKIWQTQIKAQDQSNKLEENKYFLIKDWLKWLETIRIKQRTGSKKRAVGLY